MKRTLIGVSSLLLAGSVAMGGPLNKAVVPKNAQWVFHLDAEAGLASTLGKYIVEHRAELELNDLDRVKAEVGIDPLKDIKGATIYGTGPDESDGVAVIYATAALDDMIAKLRAKKESGVEQIQLEGYSVYSWTEGEESRFAQVRPDGAGRILIAAADKDHLLSGIHILEGKGEALTGDSAGLGSVSPRVGSIIFASATKLPEAEALPFKQADGITFDAGEAEKELYADVRVTAKSSEEATNMSQVAMGAIAMARMALSNDPQYRELLQFLNGVSVTCDQKNVVGKFRMPSEQLGAALTALGEQEKAHHHKPKKDSKGDSKKESKQDAGDKD